MKEVLWHTYYVQGLSWLLVSKTMCSRSWGLPESARKEQDREGMRGRTVTCGGCPLSFLHPVLPSFDIRLIPKKNFFYLGDEALDVEIKAW